MKNTNWFKNTNPVIDEDEFIQVNAFPKEGGGPKIHYIQSQMETDDFVRSHRTDYNLFYSVGLTDGEGRKEKNIVAANIIVLDFDFKDTVKPNLIDFINELREKLNLFFFQAVDSGHGYHIYIAIEHTKEIDRWYDVTNKLVEIYGADKGAALKTQLIRIPGSLNWKNPDSPIAVNVVYSNDSKRYSLNQLELLIENHSKPRMYGEHGLVKPCIAKMLDGVESGYRNFALGRIIYDFKCKNYSREKAYRILSDWNKNRNAETKNQYDFDYEFNRYWDSDTNMGACYLKSENLQNKLNKFCFADCELKNKTIHYNKALKNIEIPISYGTPTMLQTLKGKELAMLILIHEKKNIKTADLKRMIQLNSNTCSNYIKHLIKSGLVERAGNTLSVKQYKTNNTTFISDRVLNMVLNNELSGNDFKVYLAIIWHNNYNQNPTLQALANTLNMNKSNVSTIIKKLNNNNIINNSINTIGLIKSYSLSA